KTIMQSIITFENSLLYTLDNFRCQNEYVLRILYLASFSLLLFLSHLVTGDFNVLFNFLWLHFITISIALKASRIASDAQYEKQNARAKSKDILKALDFYQLRYNIIRSIKR
ncbi:hypothetical protein ACJX0J_032447, partial [Zea mays]